MQKDQSSSHDKLINEYRAGRAAVTAAQYEAIKAAAAAKGVFFETEPAGPAPAHIWQKDHILVSSDVNEKKNPALIKLEATLARNVDGSVQRPRPDLAKLLRLGNTRGRSTGEIVDDLTTNPEYGLVDKVFRNELHYVTHGDGANLCGGDEPTPLRQYPHTIPYPPAGRGNAGLGVRVTVIDTGLSRDWEIDHPWLYDGNHSPATDVTGDQEIDTYWAGTQQIQPSAGHGTFIAGLIRCVAPRTTVHVTNTMRWAGAMHDHHVAQTIMNVLDAAEPPDIIALSGGCLTAGTGTVGPKAMRDVMQRLRRKDCHTLLVAAAGNDGTRTDSFYPAAFAGDEPFLSEGLVVAVGALRQDRLGRACFSNWADWVTVYEEGERLINAFPVGKFEYIEPQSTGTPPQCIYYANQIEDGCTCQTAPAKGTVVHFRGMAAWSGTSFATPLVVGRVVRHMTANSRFKRKPRAAFQDLLKQLDSIEDDGDSHVLRVFPKPVSG